jgi:hypothetical protein
VKVLVIFIFKIKEVMTNTNVPMTLKRRKFNEQIMPALTYGCETWRLLTTEQEQDLRVAQLSIEMLILKKSPTDRVKKAEIRAKTGLQDVIQVIKLKKWKWAGVVGRMDMKSKPKLVTMWQPDEAGEKPEPDAVAVPGRWVDEIEAFIGPDWMDRAKFKTEWNQHGEAFVYQWSESDY